VLGNTVNFSQKTLTYQAQQKDSTARGVEIKKDDVKIKKSGSQWKSQQKSEGKLLIGFVTVISEVPLSDRSHDFLKFQEAVVPVLLHNKHWRREFRERISHNYMSC